MAYGIIRLSAWQVTKLRKPGYHADGGGLYLSTKDSRAKSWIFRFRFGGKEREMGLGSLNTFTLAEARKRALRQRKLLADGNDPLGVKRAAQLDCSMAEASVITFNAAATSVVLHA